MPRKYTVRERKLGREGNDAQIDLDTGEILIDPRLLPKQWLHRLTHEAVHAAFPDASEAEVLRAERVIGGILWRAGVRRIHLK